MRRTLPGSAYGDKWTLMDNNEDPAEWTPIPYNQIPDNYIGQFFASFRNSKPHTL